MKEFRELLANLKAIPEVLSNFKSKLNLINSKRISTLLTSDDEGGLFPAGLRTAILEFEGLISWKMIGKAEIPEP